MILLPGSFIPITLEQLARERGHLQSDHSQPCKSHPHLHHAAATTTQMLGPAAHHRSEQCVVNILGTDINTASFAMYTFSISVLIQTLLILSMSGAADRGQYRKTMLVTLAMVGSVSTMLFLPVVPQVFMLGALFAIIANTCFGASFVLLNSFLPLLVRYHPDIQCPSETDPDEFSQEQRDEQDGEEQEDDPSAMLLAPSVDAELNGHTTTSQELRLSTKISANGVGIGYVAAVIVQAISIVIVLLLESSTFSLRLVLFVIGAWWFTFTIPSALWLRPRPGPPLRLPERGGKARTWLAYFTHSWRSLSRTVARARSLRDVLLFLAAWFLLSDGVATVSGTAILFAKTALAMEASALALVNVVVVTSGIAGAFAWSRVSLYVGLRPAQTILACVCLFEVIPLYGLLGYVPAVRRWGVLGLQQQWEMFPLGGVYGFVLGGLASYCRSLYGELIPEGFEAAFYALYAITDKGSSIFGPAIVGAIIDKTGEVRPAFCFLAVLIGLPIPLLYLVDVERGKRDGKALSDELNKGTALDASGYGTMEASL
ncbi:MAG: MFS transporter [Terriglobus roseus]|nr:MFS transporter [Terriglobus roseus]